jgi:predicted nucleotidyltransferase
MPVRSSTSSILRWPDRETVVAAARAWAAAERARRPELCFAGYFGSYARGDWGVGSDLDLIAVVARSDAPFERRAREWDTSALPVPAEILVYTTEEWERLLQRDDRFARVLQEEVVPLLAAEPSP